MRIERKITFIPAEEQSSAVKVFTEKKSAINNSKPLEKITSRPVKHSRINSSKPIVKNENLATEKIIKETSKKQKNSLEGISKEDQIISEE